MTFKLMTNVNGTPTEESFNDEATIADAVKTRFPSAVVQVGDFSAFGLGGVTLAVAYVAAPTRDEKAYIRIEPAITLNPSLWPLA